MKTRRFLFGLIGLMLGFIVSFIWTRDYNKRNAVAATPSGTQAAAGAPGANNQQAMIDVAEQIAGFKD